MPASDFSTSNREYFLTLPECEEDELLIEAMTGHEGVSQLFNFSLQLLSGQDAIDPRKIIGKPAILRIETWDMDASGGERHWNGYVSRFAQTGRMPSADDDGYPIYTYECDIVPWLWFLTQHEDCRIFQEKTVPQIIETIFGEFGYDDFKMEVGDGHPVLEYCTQYNETTFDFISRLIEREGIYYYFRHSEIAGETRHIVVFTDHNRSNPALEPEEIPFHHEGQAEGADAIRSLRRDEQMRTRKVTVHGWNYANKGVLSENTPTVLEIGVDRDLERYRYPGEVKDAAFPKQWSQVAMEAEESSHLHYRGDGQVRLLTPGHTFILCNHDYAPYNSEYIVLSVVHQGRNNLTANAGASDYNNTFTLQPHGDTVYRAPLHTPRGLVRGPQTAIVVGPPGEEIYTDEHGRVKVRFHWDRNVPGRTTNTQDDRATCWIRVAQMWAGNGYGTMYVPRIGMEVVVDFLEGDPDQPIILGSVYNGVNRPPLDLPSEATRSTTKTLSSKGGGGFNELRFEDKKGHEEIFVHAQKNLQVRTGNCKTEAVGVNSDLHVGKNHTQSIDENAASTVGMNETISIGLNRMLTVGADEHRTIGANQQTTIGANHSLTVGAACDLTVGSQFATEAGVGIDMKAGAKLVLEAGAVISIKAGPSSIVLSAAGVQITGPMIYLNSGGAPLMAKKPQKAEKADTPGDALKAIQSVAGKVVDSIQQLQAQALRAAAQRAQPHCAMCEARRAALEAMRG